MKNTKEDRINDIMRYLDSSNYIDYISSLNPFSNYDDSNKPPYTYDYFIKSSYRKLLCLMCIFDISDKEIITNDYSKLYGDYDYDKISKSCYSFKKLRETNNPGSDTIEYYYNAFIEFLEKKEEFDNISDPYVKTWIKEVKNKLIMEDKKHILESIANKNSLDSFEQFIFDSLMLYNPFENIDISSCRENLELFSKNLTGRLFLSYFDLCDKKVKLPSICKILIKKVLCNQFGLETHNIKSSFDEAIKINISKFITNIFKLDNKKYKLAVLFVYNWNTIYSFWLRKPDLMKLSFYILSLDKNEINDINEKITGIKKGSKFLLDNATQFYQIMNFNTSLEFIYENIDCNEKTYKKRLKDKICSFFKTDDYMEVGIVTRFFCDNEENIYKSTKEHFNLIFRLACLSWNNEKKCFLFPNFIQDKISSLQYPDYIS